MNRTHTVNLSDGTSYVATLEVYRDFIESNGVWRLRWMNPDERHFVQEQSTVTGQPFFHTMRAAVRHGEKRYGITAVRGED